MAPILHSIPSLVPSDKGIVTPKPGSLVQDAAGSRHTRGFTLSQRRCHSFAYAPHFPTPFPSRALP